MANDTTELSLASLELDKLEACVELLFFAAYADGVVVPSERATFERHVVAATRGQLPPALIQAVLTHIEGTMQGADRASRLRAIASRLQDARVRRAALVLAAEVATADGALTIDERTFLLDAAAVFDISPNELRSLPDVTL